MFHERQHGCIRRRGRETRGQPHAALARRTAAQRVFRTVAHPLHVLHHRTSFHLPRRVGRRDGRGDRSVHQAVQRVLSALRQPFRDDRGVLHVHFDVGTRGRAQDSQAVGTGLFLQCAALRGVRGDRHHPLLRRISVADSPAHTQRKVLVFQRVHRHAGAVALPERHAAQPLPPQPPGPLPAHPGRRRDHFRRESAQHHGHLHGL